MHIDIKSLTELTGGNQDITKDLFDTYLTLAKEQLTQLHEALAQGDAATLQQVAHSFKGGSSSMFLEDMAAVLKLIEQAGKDKNLVNVPAQIVQVSQELTTIRQIAETLAASA